MNSSSNKRKGKYIKKSSERTIDSSCPQTLVYSTPIHKDSTPFWGSSFIFLMFILITIIIVGYSINLQISSMNNSSTNNSSQIYINQSAEYTSQVNVGNLGNSEIDNNSIGMKFVFIPAGKFEMGSNNSHRELPIHEVTIEKAIYISKYEVTQEQWIKVMGNNPSFFRANNSSVNCVSWNDAQRFIEKLNENEGTDKYRLPTEAEWEYACRANTTTKYSFGDSEPMLGDYAWYNVNSEGECHPVGQKKPNTWGLNDMHGNLWEWVQDEWHDSYENSPTNGSAWENNVTVYRVLRGGAYTSRREACSSSSRSYDDPKLKSGDVGFRLVMMV